MYRFNESISVDIRLAIHDVNNSIAYVASLEAASIITADQAQTLTEGLESVRHEHENGRFTVQNDEDIHSANERRLREFVGSVAGCVHTARSRNDQVATDLRMWIRESGDQCFNVCKELINVLVTRAESDQSLMMAGYTHLQVILHFSPPLFHLIILNDAFECMMCSAPFTFRELNLGTLNAANQQHV